LGDGGSSLAQGRAGRGSWLGALLSRMLLSDRSHVPLPAAVRTPVGTCRP